MKLKNTVGNTSSYIYSPSFHIDNNTPPISYDISPIYEEQFGDVTIQFSSSDLEGDTLTYLSEYSLDDGLTWEQGTSELVHTQLVSTLPGNYSLSFDGEDDYAVVTGLSGAITNSNVTMMGWFKARSNGNGDNLEGLFGFRDYPNSNDFYALMNWEGYDEPTISCSFGFSSANITMTPVDSVWYHVALVYGDGVFSSYLNGELQASSGAGALSAGGIDLLIGNNIVNGSHHFDGNISGVSLWSTDLSESQIQYYMSVKPSGSEPDLIGHWAMDEGSGSNLVDNSLFDNSGTISGASWVLDNPNTTSDQGEEFLNTLLWRPYEDLPGGTDNENTIIRITPSDADPGTPTLMDGIHIDLNQVPSIELVDIYQPQVANVTIEYQINDLEGDAVDLFCEYNSGSGWQPATVLGDIENVTVYDSSLTWFSMYDIGTQFFTNVRFRITPSDNDEGNADETLPMLINNENIPPGANVFVDEGEQSDTLEIGLVLISPDGARAVGNRIFFGQRLELARSYNVRAYRTR